jgi:hypothetical protein
MDVAKPYRCLLNATGGRRAGAILRPMADQSVVLTREGADGGILGHAPHLAATGRSSETGNFIRYADVLDSVSQGSKGN